ncbi:putative DNA polymerase delta subunit 2 [Taphrina deformans PYCC 5710]|uniref:DNA-directed DNA polymerase n=1 Tax=Taphrina deformans (strain PYCC 5710 / ATCC 11124 / CBS 356.35 / IMI 108563 / JCM 9778 / NBRC 8474) TaxID=1097556 RepID=R4XD33_TAPDE|nr:putative DNA polymerase delta subunit 2 [Taphrina deformans PYCC 5710]|eukprot:CCG83513.1 putative DNA polymerase delta subunit 2 [Taphrina deformans PYCC 5710]
MPSRESIQLVAQYANIYYLRLASLKTALEKSAVEKWSAHASHTSRVLDVVQGDLTWIVGTIYMDMPLKPQVLQDLVADVNLSASVPTKSWRDPRADSIQIEDESGRLSIVGHKLQEHTLCTGIVVAVLGSETTSGEFDVIDILYPGVDISDILKSAEHQELASTDHTESTTTSSQLRFNGGLQPSGHAEDDYVAVISGLNLSGKEHAGLNVDLLVDYLTGDLLTTWACDKRANICTLVILGNSMDAASIVDDDAMSRKLTKNKKYGYDSALYNARPVEVFDDFLDSICKSIDVVLLPGDRDPTNTTLPQQPINKIMLRKSSYYCSSTLSLTTNPAFFTINERTIFGTAGQNIEDLKHYVSGATTTVEATPGNEDDNRNYEPLDLAVETLKWGHFAPTAPDTLWTYPFSDRDPFIIDSCPDIYLIGNQAHYGERLVDIKKDSSKVCRVVMIPEFSSAGEVVLINMRTLASEVIKFGSE